MTVQSLIKSLWLAMCVMALIGCGGGGGSSDEPPTPQASVSRVEISSDRLLLSAANNNAAKLAVVVYDDSGSVVGGKSVQFSSSYPSDITVDMNGNVSALHTNAVAQVTASVDGVVSNSITFTAVDIAQGAVVLPGKAVAGVIDSVDPAEPLDIGKRFRVPMDPSFTRPALGSIVVSDSVPVFFGKVTSTDSSGMTLEVMAPDDVFPDLDINATLDLSLDDISLDGEVTDNFDVVKHDDGAIEFVSKHEFVAESEPAEKTGISRKKVAFKSYQKGKLECDRGVRAALGSFKINKPSIKFKLNELKADVVYTRGRRAVTLRGPFGFDGVFTPEFSVQQGLEVTCHLTVTRITIPAGLLTFILGPEVPVGIGAKIGAAVGEFKAQIRTELQVNGGIDVGFDCVIGSDCLIPHEVSVDLKPKVEPFIEKGLRFSGEAVFFPFMAVTLNPAGFLPNTPDLLVEETRFNLKSEFKFGKMLSQIQDQWRSSYKFAGEIEISTGESIERLVKLLKIKLIDLKVNFPIFEKVSPVPRISVSESTAKYNNIDVQVIFAEGYRGVPPLEVSALYLMSYENGQLSVASAKSFNPEGSSLTFTVDRPNAGADLYLFAEFGQFYPGDYKMLLGKVPVVGQDGMFSIKYRWYPNETSLVGAGLGVADKLQPYVLLVCRDALGEVVPCSQGFVVRFAGKLGQYIKGNGYNSYYDTPASWQSEPIGVEAPASGVHPAPFGEHILLGGEVAKGNLLEFPFPFSSYLQYDRQSALQEVSLYSSMSGSVTISTAASGILKTIPLDVSAATIGSCLNRQYCVLSLFPGIPQ
jgi:hypothetical protein